MIKAPFLALERDKHRERMKSIKDFEQKKGCSGIHTLSYGSLGEHQQEMIIQQAVENQGDEEDKIKPPTDQERAEVRKNDQSLTDHLELNKEIKK